MRDDPRPICLIISRWGRWPAWFAVAARTLAANPSLRFRLVGDRVPLLHGGLPPNVQFKNISLHTMRARVRKRLGVIAPASLAVKGFHSKISDLKPMFGAIFPELLGGCEWWGYMQEDQLLGSLRSFATPALLSAHDTVSPLPLPCAGPFMLWRNTAQVNELFKRSAQWRDVVENPRYLAFDEWGQSSGRANLTDFMGAVVEREAGAGQLRAHMAADGCGGGAPPWLQEDVVRACGPWSVQQKCTYDETMHFWWRAVDGLWAGAPAAEGLQARRPPGAGRRRGPRRGRRLSAAAAAADEGAAAWLRRGRRAVAHLIASKQAPQYRGLRPTARFLARAASAAEIVLTRHGIFLRGDSSAAFEWYSGVWPGAAVRVAAPAVLAMASQLLRLGAPSVSDDVPSAQRLRRRAELAAPCALSASLDDHDAGAHDTSTCEAFVSSRPAAVAAGLHCCPSVS